ncbi:DNA-binding domain-containing protein [Maritalea mobilis]|uniref:HvfC/BufC N-terminal domain-containing protein n=1 Tax=Maritalea mobilis TaxID=483324 RepID=UPI001C94A726|nr:DNA-binding domain-containing protein [Maritalea mobilis]MBY6202332.1 DNA-binding domain-containing protein [Maritalea mobilis]
MTQDAFAAALLDADAPVPPGLTDPAGRPAPKRFAVYRNNVAASLIAALGDGFPVIKRLVGAEFFDAMAGVFFRACPPEDPRLPLWGGKFPGFLSAFPPVAHLPYLPDMARLELGLRQSYHAADARPLDVSHHDAGSVLSLRPRLAPATLVLSSPHPVLSIWRFNSSGGPKPAPGPEDILIARARFDPAPHALPKGGLTLARHLKGKLTLAEALTATQAAHPGADMAALLTVVLTSGALTLDFPLPEA